MANESRKAEGDENLLITEELEGRTKFVTSGLINREFELRARTNIVDAYKKMREAKMKRSKLLQMKKLLLPKDILDLPLTDLLKQLGNPATTSALIQNLLSVPKKPVAHVTFADLGVNSSAETRNPSGLCTPQIFRTPKNYTAGKRTPLFTFESAFRTKVAPSAIKKEPRPPKPGEQIFTFSASGSPVLVENNRTTAATADSAARIKIDAGNGQSIDVDLVFRDGPPEARNKIVTDFRCWAKSRSTVQSKKFLPHRPPVKKTGSLTRSRK